MRIFPTSVPKVPILGYLEPRGVELTSHEPLGGSWRPRPSRVGPPRWKHPEMVAGTRRRLSL